MTEIFKNDMGLFNSELFKIFDQDYCIQAPDETGFAFGFIRDIEKIWAEEDC